MAISIHTPGSWAAASATTQTATLPTHSTGDMLLVRAGMKHATLPGDITCGTSGWARVGQFNNGTTASGNGTGDVQVACFWKVATSASETNPVITFHASVAATPSCVEARSYQKGAGETWSTPVGDGGGISAALNFDATIQTHVSATAGDMLDAFAVTNDNTTLTVPTVTQAGLTLAAVTESPAAALSSGTSNDISADGCYRLANSGTSSAAAHVTGTNSASDVGAAWVTRLRVFTPENHDGAIAGTGGGVYTNVGQKGAQLAATGTGAGIATLPASKGGQVALAGTGAGVATEVATTDRGAVVAGTGGGILTWDYAVESGEQHSGSLVGTGSGAATFGFSGVHNATLTTTGAGVGALVAGTDRPVSLTATGGGVATLGTAFDRTLALAATGGGVATLPATTDRGLGLAATGAGVLGLGQSSQRSVGLTGTGSGVATFEGTQAEDHSGVIFATGGGAAAFDATTDRQAALVATGAGTFAVGWAGGHSLALVATGGGRATFDGTGGVGASTGIERVLVVAGSIARTDVGGSGVTRAAAGVHGTISGTGGIG